MAVNLKSKCKRIVGRNLHICYKLHAKKFEDIPGPKSLPIIGTLYKYLPVIGSYKFDNLYQNGLKKLKKYGPIVRERIVPGVNLLWLFKPDDIEVLFRTEGKYPQRRSHLALEKYRLDRPNVYNTGGLLPTNGPEWFRIRSVFQKGLSSPTSVQNFLPGANEVIQEWLEQVAEVKSAPNNDYLPYISRLYLELTCLMAFDLRLNSFSRDELQPSSRSSQLMEAAMITNSCILKTDNGPQIWRKLNTPLYRKLRKAQRYMEEYNDIKIYLFDIDLIFFSVAIDLLSLKMSLYKEVSSVKSESLLESYLSSPELDFRDIIGLACDFLLAGIDTTSYSTSFILYHLAKNQPAQSMLYNETCKLLPHRDSPVTADILKEANYAKAVLKESLRLRPISVGIGRVLTADAEFSGYNVPINTVVVSQNQVSCRLNEYFSSANEFKPDRWLKNHPLYKAPHPYLLLPFGHGARSCIARRLAEQNMLILTIKLIRNYKIGWNGFDIDTRSLLINKPDGPISLTIEKRHH